MMNRRIVLLAAFALLATQPVSATAQKLYKWVDKNGKVHYSQTPPSEATKSESKLDIPKQDSTSDEQVFEDGRNADGACRTMKCMADEMEADRLQRERGYAEQRRHNDGVLTRASEQHALKEREEKKREQEKRERFRRIR